MPHIPKLKGPSNSLASRLFFAILAGLLPIGLLFGAWVYRSAEAALESELGRSLETAATLIGHELELRAGGTLKRLQPDSDHSREFLLESLADMQRHTGYRRILVVNPELQILVDTEAFEPFEEAHVLRADLPLFADGHGPASSVLFRRADGSHTMRGYAPLAWEGERIGTLVVEGDAEFFGALALLRARILGSGVVLLAIAALVIAWFTRRVTASLRQLARTAGEIGQGNFSVEIPLTGYEELATLANALERMQRSLAAREEESRLMLAGVAHEIRNPLGGMELQAGLLAEELHPDTPAWDHLERIRHELQYLGRVVSDFLRFAQDTPLSWSEFPATELTESLLWETQENLGDKRLQVDIQPPDLRLTADPTALRSVLINLIRNALEASPSGGVVELSIRATPQARQIEVRDSGPGIDPEHLESIFRPFFTTREKGTGLGLPLARRTAERHGGTLELRSSPSAGTTLVLHLPYVPEQISRSQAAPRSPASGPDIIG